MPEATAIAGMGIEGDRSCYEGNIRQVVDMESTLGPVTSGGVQSLIDSFDLLMLMVVALVGIGLMVAVISAIRGR